MPPPYCRVPCRVQAVLALHIQPPGSSPSRTMWRSMPSMMGRRRVQALSPESADRLLTSSGPALPCKPAAAAPARNETKTPAPRIAENLGSCPEVRVHRFRAQGLVVPSRIQKRRAVPGCDALAAEGHARTKKMCCGSDNGGVFRQEGLGGDKPARKEKGGSSGGGGRGGPAGGGGGGGGVGRGGDDDPGDSSGGGSDGDDGKRGYSDSSDNDDDETSTGDDDQSEGESDDEVARAAAKPPRGSSLSGCVARPSRRKESAKLPDFRNLSGGGWDVRQHGDGSDFASMKWTKTGEEYTVAYNRVAKSQLHLTPDSLSFLEPCQCGRTSARAGEGSAAESSASLPSRISEPKCIRSATTRRVLPITYSASYEPTLDASSSTTRTCAARTMPRCTPSVLGVSRTSRKWPEAENCWLRGLQRGRGSRGKQGHPRSRRRRTRSGTCSSTATARGPTTRFACSRCTRLTGRSSRSISNRGSPGS